MRRFRGRKSQDVSVYGITSLRSLPYVKATILTEDADVCWSDAGREVGRRCVLCLHATVMLSDSECEKHYTCKFDINQYILYDFGSINPHSKGLIFPLIAY